MIITVSPIPDVYFNPPSQTICSGLATNIHNLSHVAGSTFTWTASGSSPNISGFSGGSGNTIFQTLVSTSFTIETVTYLVTPSVAGCPGIPGSVVITVNPGPVMSNMRCIDSLTTTGAKPFTLKGGLPVGGTYSGPGVFSGIFYPAIAGTGNKTIGYSYTNTYGCAGTSSKVIVVTASAMFTCGNSLTDIRDNNQYPTVMIGNQCWMAANLNFGTVISAGLVQRDNCLAEKYCYNNSLANCSTDGGLYQWNEMMSYTTVEAVQGLCPPGWHIPSDRNGLSFSLIISAALSPGVL